MRVNPIYKKELKIGVRSIKMAFIIMGFNMILAIIGLFAFYIIFNIDSNIRRVDYSGILNLYLVIAIIEVGLVFFLVPAYTAGTISGERERQTLEILLTTRVKPLQIIIGKLASSISTIILLSFSSLPIISIVFAVGGVRFVDVLQLMLYIFITSIFIGSIGLLFSCICKKTVMATVFTYGTLVGICMGTVVLIGIISLMAHIKLQGVATAANMIREVDLGNTLLILLVNPAVSLMSMMNNQYGGTSMIESYFDEMGSVTPFFMDHWFGVSMIVQLFVAVLLIFWSAKILNPIKKRAGVKNEPK